MNIFILFISVLAFVFVVFLISFLAKPRGWSQLKKSRQENILCSNRVMKYIHNENSGVDVQEYIDLFNSKEEYAPHYVGWRLENE